MVSASLVAALPLLSVAHAAVIEHWWNISYATANPDTVSGSSSDLLLTL